MSGMSRCDHSADSPDRAGDIKILRNGIPSLDSDRAECDGGIAARFGG